jgi:hypothetical protein
MFPTPLFVPFVSFCKTVKILFLWFLSSLAAKNPCPSVKSVSFGFFEFFCGQSRLFPPSAFRFPPSSFFTQPSSFPAQSFASLLLKFN